MSHLERDNSKNEGLWFCYGMSQALIGTKERGKSYSGDLKSGEDFILRFSTYIVLSNISNSMRKLWVKCKPYFYLLILSI